MSARVPTGTAFGTAQSGAPTRRRRPSVGGRLAATALALVLAGSLTASTPQATSAFGPDDTTPPSFGAAQWTGPNTPIQSVLLLWNDLLDESALPAVGDFAVELDDVGLAIDSVEFTHAGFVDPENAATIMTLFLADPVSGPGTLTVSYTPITNPVTDVAGHQAGAAVDVPVEIFAFETFGVAMALVDGNYGRDHLGLAFSDAVDPLTVPPASAFSVTRNGTPMTPTSVSILPAFGGRILDLALPQGFRSGDTATVTYHAPVAGGIENLAGTAAPDFEGADVLLLLVAQDAVTGSTGETGSVSTDAGDPGPTAQDPTATTVSVTGEATVSIDEGATEYPPSVPEYTFIGETVEIVVSPPGPFDPPIAIDFAIDASLLAAEGATEATVQLFRNGVQVEACTGAAGVASPDPCITARTAVPGPPDPLEYAVIRVLTSQASTWVFAVRTPYPWSGFFAPVDNPPTVNLAIAGGAIPVKFSLGGDRGLDILAPGYPISVPVDCASGAPVDAIEQTVSAGSSSLTYDAATDRYTYVWKTAKSWSVAPGGPCRTLVLAFDDGSEREAWFTFR